MLLREERNRAPCRLHDPLYHSALLDDSLGLILYCDMQGRQAYANTTMRAIEIHDGSTLKRVSRKINDNVGDFET